MPATAFLAYSSDFIYRSFSLRKAAELVVAVSISSSLLFLKMVGIRAYMFGFSDGISCDCSLRFRVD